MTQEKKRILTHRITWLVILIAVVITPIILNFIYEDLMIYFIYFFILIDLIFLLLFLQTLSYSYKEYDYNETTISVYVGFYHHTLKVNGEIYDKHDCIMSFTPITLSCTLIGGEKVSVTISTFNSVTLKINDRLYNNIKK